MNAYFCNAGWHDIIQEVIDYWTRTEPAFLCDVVFAESPGKAKSIFMRRANAETMGSVEFTDIKVKALRRGVRRRAGLARHNDTHWRLVG